MNLTKEEKEILEGKQGETLAKIMKTLVMYGDAFGAKRLVPISHTGHLVTSFGIGLLKPVYSIMDELIASGIKSKFPFTVDPRPIDYKNVKCGPLNKLIFSKIMYSKQKFYEDQLLKVGLVDKNKFTCTCYLEEVGNKPKMGDILSWAESSAVVFANSVLGARCNRNSGMIDLFGCVVGKVPEFGFLTDEGRKANFIVEVKTKEIPEAQILGSAIGMAVMEGTPYIKGLDKFLGNKIDDETLGYLKDMGAATASNGAVGLYHIEGLTPEAKKFGDKLILKGAKKIVITDKTLEDTYKNYPIMWKDLNAKPTLCFIGCPHLTLIQLKDWTNKLIENLGGEKVKVKTVFTASPSVVDEFKQTKEYSELIKTGVKLSSICPLMYMNNPIASKKPVITNSNKLRTYTKSRYYKDNEILQIICKGGLN